MASQTLKTTANNTKAIAGIVEGTLFLCSGLLFGVVAYKSQILSWYRIQEMFRFQSFHMYGIIASAVAVAALSLWIIKRTKAKSLFGEEIRVAPKEKGSKRYVLGGSIFGLGWAMTGACPGPLLTLVGAGSSVFLVVILSAIFGTWVYGAVRKHLPH